MRSILFAASLAAAGLAVPAQALIYYSNYTPSNVPVTQTTGGQYPVERRLPDASQSFDSFGVIREFQFGVVCCTFRTERVITEFVAPTSFTAAALVVPLKHYASVGNRNMAFTVQRFDNGSWVNARNEPFAIVPTLTTGVITEVEIKFGVNSTNLPQFFTPRPVPFVAGQSYRIITSVASGGIGRVDWYLSDTPATAGQSRQTYNYKSAVDLAFQPAFALTDGGDLSFPVLPDPDPPYEPPTLTAVPEPASWAMLIAGFGLIGATARRRSTARLA